MSFTECPTVHSFVCLQTRCDLSLYSVDRTRLFCLGRLPLAGHADAMCGAVCVLTEAAMTCDAVVCSSPKPKWPVSTTMSPLRPCRLVLLYRLVGAYSCQFELSRSQCSLCPGCSCTPHHAVSPAGRNASCFSLRECPSDVFSLAFPLLCSYVYFPRRHQTAPTSAT